MMHVALDQLGGPIGLTVYIGALAIAGFVLPLRGLPWWYQTLAGIAAALAVAGLWLTCLADPGVIPAAHEPDVIFQQLEAGAAVPETHLYSRDPRGVWMRRTDQDRAAAYSKYCTTCNIWRPPRSHHCSTCNACMVRWDHHCAVVGNCVAGRNHRYFAGFLIAGQLGCLLCLAGAIWRLRQKGLPSPGTWMGAEGFLLIVAAVVYGYTATMLIFGTAHCLGIICDITTKDVLTDQHLWRNPPCCPGARSPSSLMRSWQRLCCAPTTCRPWQTQRLRQQQHPQQRMWQRLPVADEAGSSGSSDVPTHAAQQQGEQVVVVGSAAPLVQVQDNSNSSSSRRHAM